MMRSICKPPIARSPIRLRSRRVLPATSNSMQTPPGSLTKSEKPKRAMGSEEVELRPEYRTISCELRALAKMVHKEFGNNDAGDVGYPSGFNANRSPLFERGRFYEEYSARRNERLKRKKGVEIGEEKKAVYGLGVRVESVKRRGEAKKYESSCSSLRKTVGCSTPMMTERRVEAATPRYMLRSITRTESNKSSMVLATPLTSGMGGRKTGARRVRKI